MRTDSKIEDNPKDLYYIKIGKFYVRRFFVEEEAIQTEFISEINLSIYPNFGDCVKVYEEEQERYIEKFKKILNIENDAITFENTDKIRE